jgi:hypothetical protein
MSFIEHVKEVKRFMTKPVFGFFHLMAYGTGIAYFVGKDGIKSALSIFGAFCMLFVGAIVINWLETRGEKKL